MNYQRLPIWQQANRLLFELEISVKQFSRYHKYSVGLELRQTVLRLCKAIHRAFTRKNSKIKCIQHVVELIDDLKFQLQLTKELKAFKNFAQYEQLAELVVSLGKQAGGWFKQAKAEVNKVKLSVNLN
ncbi:hypothetical protein CMT41_00560 [Colwellia sp. MT41]|uniref:four helix bundle protein n=1 Tax=Colwellia sp. MT41 TaxID=58049 RepID=UPI000717B102|nr:four helix bundle protein [Colwellia sp. MT41]ALO33367.1 hypothetical protein CMT41_00560 [Colwellia sp. MT41]